MKKTAEAVSIGHPDKIADFISSYILDRLIEQDSAVRYAIEVMIKDNNVVFGGEISGAINLDNINDWVISALADIGYTKQYAGIWGTDSIEPDKVKIINLIGAQSTEIGQGVDNHGWGDQGVFVGYACRGDGLINRELYLAKKLNDAIYNLALNSENLGLDIKTQVTLNGDKIETVIVAVPMRESQNLTEFIIKNLGQVPENIIINGTGAYTRHASIADCGITGRKLACDFYSTAAPIGGGSPWTKDGTKADLTLNIYARMLACENLGDNDECFVYLSSCIGRNELPSGLIKTVKDGVVTNHDLWCNLAPDILIRRFGLDNPVYANLCKMGICGITNIQGKIQ